MGRRDGLTTSSPKRSGMHRERRYGRCTGLRRPMLRPVFTTLCAFVATLASSQLVGAAVLRLSGWRGSPWIAGPVGLGLLVCISGVALHFPGGAVAVGIGMIAGVGAAVAYLWKRGVRPTVTVSGAVAVLPALVVAGLPLIIYQRSGIFGVSLNNDMAAHLLMSDAYRYADVFAARGLAEAYPTGPHAMVAVLGALIGGDTAEIFTGFTMATFVFGAVATLAFVRDAPPIGSAVVVLVAGCSFLFSAYFVQGSFKETMLVSFLFATGALLMEGARVGRTRWIPLAVVCAGTLSTYSYAGLAWVLPLVGCWFVVRVAQQSLAGRMTLKGRAWIRANFGALATGVSVFVVLIVPQAPRILDFARGTRLGEAVGGAPLGNLAGTLPFWEAFGVWPNTDYRLVPADQITAGVWAGLMLAAAALGAVWLIRKGNWIVPLMTATTALVWFYLDSRQMPYFAAKGLVVLSPMIGLLVVTQFVEREGWLHSARGWWRALAVCAAVSLAWGASTSIASAVSSVRLGPLDHVKELRSFATTIGRSRVLFLGNDDFLHWASPRADWNAPFVGALQGLIRPEKTWVYGQGFDIDTIPTDTVNSVDYLVSPRDPAASALPSQFREVARTKSFGLYRRVGRMPARILLQEGADATKVLNCRQAAGRALERRPLRAAVRAESQRVELPVVQPGRSTVVSVPLSRPGRWALSLQYTSAQQFSVSADGQSWSMPANLDRPGSRFLVGTVESAAGGSLSVTLRVRGGWLSRRTDPLAGALFATPVGTGRLVPVAEACGKPVDYLVRDVG